LEVEVHFRWMYSRFRASKQDLFLNIFRKKFTSRMIHTGLEERFNFL
jgi:hypothetical protein